MIKATVTLLIFLYFPTSPFAQDTTKTEPFWVRYAKQLNFDSGMVAPNFSYRDINGKVITLGDYKGKIVALYFWSSECEESVDDMDACISKTIGIFKKFYPEDVVFINVGEELSKRKWKNTVEKHAPEGYNIYSFVLKRKLSKQFNLIALPRMVLIGPDGIVMGTAQADNIHLLSYFLRSAIKGIGPASAFRKWQLDPSFLKEHDQWFFSNKLGTPWK
jgi:hypothetical protein